MNAKTGETLKWRKMNYKNDEIFSVSKMLCAMEENYTCACARFISRNPSKDPVWLLCGKKHQPKALIINSRSTLLPVFSGMKEVPSPKFLNSFFQLKKIHSVQGLKEEVLFLESAIENFGREISDSIDYDLMCLESKNNEQLKKNNLPVQGLTLRAPGMTDLDALAPLQAAYEQEEVMHKNSIFSPAASRINLANIISEGRILAAELNGKLVGKINVSGISFSKYTIGGVFVHPDYRGQGIARVMTSHFLSSLLGTNECMGAALFVKKSNIPAQKLYLGLGFKVLCDYRITYF
ncbi:MAG: GNAT family N-acetyltransferase [Treponema sp.]|nr:GNAT family N-acetyltransferase [Treponema sp.]